MEEWKKKKKERKKKELWASRSGEFASFFRGRVSTRVVMRYQSAWADTCRIGTPSPSCDISTSSRGCRLQGSSESPDPDTKYNRAIRRALWQAIPEAIPAAVQLYSVVGDGGGLQWHAVLHVRNGRRVPGEPEHVEETGPCAHH